MSFTKELFEQTAQALPEITTRTFSKYCGKSEGYYGSIRAQNVEISTNSLVYLAEILQYRNSIAPSKALNSVISTIVGEISKRIQSIEVENIEVRKMIIQSIVKTNMESDRCCSAPPIVIA
ncbi:hypothetical protein [Limnohabitans parvus]|uniref:hypothetical protein n=1 Tax=Limnohabitans parvus TaxID=540061 RepID=UPI0011B1EEEF|nr:hypothetical protein [Limnohabitans parvus]